MMMYACAERADTIQLSQLGIRWGIKNDIGSRAQLGGLHFDLPTSCNIYI